MNIIFANNLYIIISAWDQIYQYYYYFQLQWSIIITVCLNKSWRGWYGSHMVIITKVNITNILSNFIWLKFPSKKTESDRMWKSDLWPFYLAVLLLSRLVRLAEIHPEVFQTVSQLAAHSSCHSSHRNDEAVKLFIFPPTFSLMLYAARHVQVP